MKKYKKRIIWTLIILAVVVGGFFLFKGKKVKTTYTTEETKKGNLVQTVSVTGTVKSEVNIDLAFKTNGIIKEMNVNIGDHVDEGDLLSKIDLGTLGSDYVVAQQEIQTQKNNLYSLNRKTGYSLEERNAQRSQIKKYEASLQGIKSRVNDTLLYAPVSGTIIKRSVDEGEMAIAGSGILTIADGELQIETKVPESDIIKVAMDQSADVTLDAFPSDQKFKAKVIEIEPASTVIQDVVYYIVKLKFDSVDPKFKVGMSCDVDIRTAEKDNVISIPLRAIKNEDGKKYVEVMKDDKNNIIEKAFVTTGLEGDEGMVEISSGLSGGEKVVTFESTK